jgi:CRP-like cAMP-binding protein
MRRRRATRGVCHVMALPSRALVQPTTQLRNHILSTLPEAELAQLAAALDRVCMASRELAFDVDAPISHVYFPETCVISIVCVATDGSAVETASVGWEGMVGLPVFLGAESTPAQAFCQIPGEALRLDTGTLQRTVASGGELRSILGRYTQAHFTQVAQASACNRIHTMRQRCARWLLQTHDRVASDEFPLTQRFLSQMLGVRRATVTEAARALQQAGVITYVHGRVTVRDRRGLERASCECYSIIRREFERLLEGRARPSPLAGVRVSSRGQSLAGDGVTTTESGLLRIEPPQ